MPEQTPRPQRPALGLSVALTAELMLSSPGQWALSALRLRAGCSTPAIEPSGQHWQQLSTEQDACAGSGNCPLNWLHSALAADSAVCAATAVSALSPTDSQCLSESLSAVCKRSKLWPSGTVWSATPLRQFSHRAAGERERGARERGEEAAWNENDALRLRMRTGSIPL
jgi:hypothetical protein